MNLMLTVNFWFLVSLCLFALFVGVLIGGRMGRRLGSDRLHY